MGFQSTKGAEGLAFLCLNLPPTTLLPSSYARCSMQGTRSGRLPGPTWVGKERAREEVHRLCRQRAGEQNRESSWGALGNANHLFLVSPDQVGVGRHSTSKTGKAGGFGRGKPYLGSGPSPRSTDFIPDLSFLALVHVLCAAAFGTGGSTGGELTLSDKDGKPKVHSIPDSSIVNGGGPLSAPREQARGYPNISLCY